MSNAQDHMWLCRLGSAERGSHTQNNQPEKCSFDFSGHKMAFVMIIMSAFYGSMEKKSTHAAYPLYRQETRVEMKNVVITILCVCVCLPSNNLEFREKWVEDGKQAHRQRAAFFLENSLVRPLLFTININELFWTKSE